MRLLRMKKIHKLFFFCSFITGICLSQSTEEKEESMYVYFAKGQAQMYVQKDSAYTYFEKAARLARGLQDYNSLLGVLDHIILAADLHDDIVKYQNALKRMDSLMTNEEVRLQIEDLEYWDTAYMGKLGIFHNQLKEYAKAKNIFLGMLSKWKGIPLDKLNSSQAETLYGLNGYLGKIYGILGKYDLADQYYQSNLSLIESNELFSTYKESYRIGVEQMLAQLYTSMGQHKKANPYYFNNLEWSKKFYEKDKRYKNNLLNAYQRITQSYIAQDSLQKALYFLDESRHYLLDDDPFQKDALLLYGDIYSGLNENHKAMKTYREALTAFLEFRQNRPHEDIAQVYGKIAELFLKQKDYNEGLKTVQKAFNTAGNKIQINNFQQNPNPNEVFSKTQLLNLLNLKLQLLQSAYEETKEFAYQEAILNISHDILETFDLLKTEFESKLDKQFLAEKAYPIFHRLLENVYTIYQKDPSTQNLELALNIAEKNKDFMLLEALRNSQATQYGNVPENVLENEAQLRAEITKLEKQMFDATETENGYSEALFKLKQEYYAFLDTLKVKYPRYHELKYQNRTLELATVRKELLEEYGTLISFSMSENYLYTIVINGSKADFLKLPFDKKDREAIGTFYRLLSSPSIKGGEKKLANLAGHLYEKILQKPLADFNTGNLTIIPDGELHYLPFDLLQKDGSNLLSTTNIGYGNSVTSLLELREKENTSANKMLAFAPTFSGTVGTDSDRQFGKLLYNDDEVKKVGSFFDTETVLDHKATLKNFKAKIPSFNIFHLATHASANDKYPDYSYLAFTKANDSAEQNILYIKDLYNISLNADMVTLSACQTGIGKLKQGQGMLSLSKGFYYAGAKSLVNTLWKINDKSTVKLMEYFYEGLGEGKSKTEALRNAKLKYLQTTDDELLKHPYYWAAFVVSGNTEPIVSNSSYWWWLLLIPSIMLIMWYFKKRKSI